MRNSLRKAREDAAGFDLQYEIMETLSKNPEKYRWNKLPPILQMPIKIKTKAHIKAWNDFKI